MERFISQDLENEKPSIENVDIAEEHRLLSQIKSEGPGSEAAQKQLMLLSMPLIERIANNYKRFMHKDELEDFIQDQFFEIPKLVEKYDPEIGRFAGQLIVRVDGNGKDLKKPRVIKKEELPVLDAVDDYGLSPKDRLLDQSQNTEQQVIDLQPDPDISFDGLVEGLKPEHQDLLKIYYSDSQNMTTAEMSAVLDIPESTFYYRHGEALKKIAGGKLFKDYVNDLKEHDNEHPFLSTQIGDDILKSSGPHTTNNSAPEEIDIFISDDIEESRKLSGLELLAARVATKNIPEPTMPELKPSKDTPINIKNMSQIDLNTLRHLHIPTTMSTGLLKVSASKINNIINELKEKTGCKTRPELALWALEQGVEYDIPESPALSSLTAKECLVACNIWQETEDLMDTLGMDYSEIKDHIESIMEKTGARNYTTIALTAKIYNLEANLELATN